MNDLSKEAGEDATKRIRSRVSPALCACARFHRDEVRRRICYDRRQRTGCTICRRF